MDQREFMLTTFILELQSPHIITDSVLIVKTLACAWMDMVPIHIIILLRDIINDYKLTYQAIMK